LRVNGNLDQAASALHRVVTLNDNDFEAHHLLGNVLRDQQQVDQAILSYRRAIKLNPRFSEAMLDLGNALRLQAQLVDACDCYRQAIAINPDYALAHYNLGVTLMEQRSFADAINSYRQAIAIAPQLFEAQWNCALALLMIGNYSEGWPLFDSRLQQGPKLIHRFTQPRWQGENLTGKTILVHAEQGFGDTLQFVRYLALLQERYHPSKLIFECQPELKSLFTNMAGMAQIAQIVAGNVDPLPSFDVQIPLLSLPLLFKTRLESVPHAIPYIAVPDTLQENWKTRLAGEKRKKIGVAWAGRPTHPHDMRRSIPFKTISSLFFLEDFCFVSLQKAASNVNGSSESPLMDWTAELTNFADTAALISQLDLVISVDTAVAHLAGAMGKPTWLLNSFESEWRWMLDRTDSVWYPGMQIFRQPGPGDWESVVQQVATALAQKR
ncbi:MAG: tetratricopeptide repeat-containing glycosyltransferase family protein, partial [Burkholderiaceae bacterium]